MKKTRKIIQIDEALCNGCGECVPACQEGAIQIVDGKARLVADKYCDGLGACLGECPTGALKIVEREAEDFDEATVQPHRAPHTPVPVVSAHSGCPGARLRTFRPAGAAAQSAVPLQSALTHWPVQIRLVPAHAPYLQNADLLVTADCVPVATAEFHRTLLPGRVALIGCPKFDDVQLYVQRLADIFAQNTIRSVTVAVMEVPCCQSLPTVVMRGMELAGVQVPLETVTVQLTGEILKRTALIA